MFACPLVKLTHLVGRLAFRLYLHRRFPLGRCMAEGSAIRDVMWAGLQPIGVITRKCVLRTLRENGPGTSRFDGSDGLLEGLVEGGFADFQASGGLTNGEARRNMRPSFTQLVGRDDGPAAALAAALACGT